MLDIHPCIHNENERWGTHLGPRGWSDTNPGVQICLEYDLPQVLRNAIWYSCGLLLTAPICKQQLTNGLHAVDKIYGAEKLVCLLVPGKNRLPSPALTDIRKNWNRALGKEGIKRDYQTFGTKYVAGFWLVWHKNYNLPACGWKRPAYKEIFAESPVHNGDQAWHQSRRSLFWKRKKRKSSQRYVCIEKIAALWFFPKSTSWWSQQQCAGGGNDYYRGTGTYNQA